MPDCTPALTLYRLLRTCCGLFQPSEPTRIELTHATDYTEELTHPALQSHGLQLASPADGSDTSSQGGRQALVEMTSALSQAPEDHMKLLPQCQRYSASEDSLYPTLPGHKQFCPPLIEGSYSGGLDLAALPKQLSLSPELLPVSQPPANPPPPLTGPHTAVGQQQTKEAQHDTSTDLQHIDVAAVFTPSTAPGSASADDPTALVAANTATPTASATLATACIGSAIATSTPPARHLPQLLTQFEEQQILRLPNKNRPSEYAWLGGLLTSIMSNAMQVHRHTQRKRHHLRHRYHHHRHHHLARQGHVPLLPPHAQTVRDCTSSDRLQPMFVVTGACPNSFCGMQAHALSTLTGCDTAVDPLPHHRPPSFRFRTLSRARPRTPVPLRTCTHPVSLHTLVVLPHAAHGP